MSDASGHPSSCRACTLPHRLCEAGPEGTRPPWLQDPGGLGFFDGRNPLSDTTDVTSGVSAVAGDSTITATAPRRRRSGTGLSAMLLPELQSLAASLGISGTARMRKGELITAITERQGGGQSAPAAASVI